MSFNEADHPREDDGKFAGKESKPLHLHGEDISRKHRDQSIEILKGLAAGTYSHEDANEDAKINHTEAIAASHENFVNRYRAWREHAREKYGDKALESPEWQEVKKAYGTARNHAERLHDATKANVTTSASPFWKNHAKSHEQARELHSEQITHHDKAVHKIADALERFLAVYDKDAVKMSLADFEGLRVRGNVEPHVPFYVTLRERLARVMDETGEEYAQRLENESVEQ